METLVRLGVATAELFEAEARVLRRSLVRLAAAAGIGLLLIVIALAGLGFFLSGLFMLAELKLPPSAAAILVGVGAMLVAGLGLLGVKRLVT
jgi:hypothetical protein